jgi:hypothetical protein
MVIAHFFPDYCMEWLVLTVMCQNQLFLGHESISALEIRVESFAHWGFQILNS